MVEIEILLKKYAEEYEVPAFISSDPIQFPHRYSNKRDIEISGFITSWFSYGNRKAIIAKCDEVDCLMGRKPTEYILNSEYDKFKSDDRSLYRFYKYSDFYCLCKRLNHIYTQYEDLEAAVCVAAQDNPVRALQLLFNGLNGIPKAECNSACKRIAMFARWMVRKGSSIDFGLWTNVSPASLVIPLDVHVFRQATLLGLTTRKSADMVTAREITDKLSNIFKGDPTKGDFALFGYGVNNKC